MRFGAIVSLIYLLASLGLWVRWQLCSGRTWLCSAPLLEPLAGPWTRWLRWSEALGAVAPRLFLLPAVCLNARIIFWVVRAYAWTVRRSWRRRER